MKPQISVNVRSEILDNLLPSDINFDTPETRAYLLSRLSQELEQLLEILTEISDDKVTVNELRTLLSSKGYHFCF